MTGKAGYVFQFEKTFNSAFVGTSRDLSVPLSDYDTRFNQIASTILNEISHPLFIVKRGVRNDKAGSGFNLTIFL